MIKKSNVPWQVSIVLLLSLDVLVDEIDQVAVRHLAAPVVGVENRIGVGGIGLRAAEPPAIGEERDLRYGFPAGLRSKITSRLRCS